MMRVLSSFMALVGCLILLNIFKVPNVEANTDPTFMTYQEFKKLHSLMAQVLIEEEYIDRRSEGLIPESVYNNNFNYFKTFSYTFSFLLNDTYARSNYSCKRMGVAKAPLYGGWITLKNRRGRAIPPWKLNRSQKSCIQSKFGKQSTYRHSCRASGLRSKTIRRGRRRIKSSYYRCNPTLFGKPKGSRLKGEENKYGYCVQLPLKGKSGMQGYTLACTKRMLNKNKVTKRSNLKDFFLELNSGKNPKMTKNFSRTADHLINYCRLRLFSNDGCRGLQSYISNLSQISCTIPKVKNDSNQGLLTWAKANLNKIQKILTPLKEKKIEEKIKESYNNAKNQAKSTLDKRNLASIRKNYPKMINLPKLKRIMERNAAECKFNSKRCKKPSKKKIHTSTGFCLAYVRLALAEHGLLPPKPKSLAEAVLSSRAKNSGRHLKRFGFTNLKDTHKNLTAKNAPNGSILVYTKGKSGHAEIKLGNNSYASDFFHRKPRDAYGSTRKLIGVYVKIK